MKWQRGAISTPKEQINCWYCPFCKQLALQKTDYCPNCGTDMRGEEHKNGETFTREELTKWLLTFVHKNSVLGKQCERLIKKLDDFETFVADMRGEE